MKERIDGILSKLGLEEKAALCSGRDMWTTKEFEALGIPSVMMTDGPHGLRKQRTDSDHLGLFESVPATCFPSGAGLASSWDTALIRKVGEALGKEARAEQIALLLGPAVNIKRSPLCGRNFEYFSEDPLLSSDMAKAYIDGVQSQGVGTSIKHFAANNQEKRRVSLDTIVDERSLREIYLASFESAIKDGKPWSVMSAYNKINGSYCSDNSYLLNDILRDEWGFEGFVVSDWGAEDNRIQGIKAGMDLEMPGNGGMNDAKIVEAVKKGLLDEKALDRVVRRLIEFALKAQEVQNGASVRYDTKEHDKLARSVAAECMVLLKNDDAVLPIAKECVVALVGELAEKPRFQGGGSSHINPTYLHNVREEMSLLGTVSYAQGYELESDEENETLVREALDLAKRSEVVVVCAGLPDRYESEGYDRKHISIPANQVKLIETIAAYHSNVVVVLSNGSVVDMPWIDSVAAVLEGYLGGQAGAGAVADLLYGNANPSAKLAETFPHKLEDTPAYLFSSEGNSVRYNEGIFVGYRYYDTKQLEPLFPFGHGLSYTSFEYSNIRVGKEKISDRDSVEVRVTVKNTGSRAGKEIVQLYVRDVVSTVNRPEKELKGFAKLSLAPGEASDVVFTLDKRAFAYYNQELGDWHVESGDFAILVGPSSKITPLRANVHVQSTVTLKVRYTLNSPISDVMQHPVAAKELAPAVENMMAMFSSTNLFAADAAQEMGESLTLKMLMIFGGITPGDVENLLAAMNA